MLALSAVFVTRVAVQAFHTPFCTQLEQTHRVVALRAAGSAVNAIVPRQTTHAAAVRGASQAVHRTLCNSRLNERRQW